MSRPKQIQISDMFGVYPSTDDPQFNKLLSQKEEFLELSPGLTETRPAPGKGFRHQRFAVRILTWYNRLLLLHYPGTGKSCIIAHSAELFKREYYKNPSDPTKIKRAIILVRGNILKENIRNEIVCKCTDHIYETDFVMRAGNEKTMRANIKRELDSWYDIMSYHQFASHIRKFQREEDLDEYMSNKAIYVDEAQGTRKIGDITSYEIPKLTINEVASSSKPETTYQTLFRAFHKGYRNVIVLATATPMINLPIDMIPLMNMILPVNLLLPPMSDEFFVTRKFEELEPYFRGRVSYIRPVNTGAIKEAQGQPAFWGGRQLLVKIEPCAMSRFQYAVYLRANELDGAQNYKKSFFDNSRQASNFVFPDGSYGTQGFNKYIEYKRNRYNYAPTADGADLKSKLQVPYYLSQLSAKYSEILDLCKSSYSSGDVDVVLDDDKGIIFVYFADYIHGSGAIMLGFALKAQGYEEFRENRTIFLSSQDSNVNLGPCSHVVSTKIDRPIRIPKAKRYAILTSKTNKSQIPTILHTLNSYENRFGEYVQVLIGSKTAREGISVNNSIKMIMASSNWNQSTNLQSENRVFRTTSHEMRLADKKARLESDKKARLEAIKKAEIELEAEEEEIKDVTITVKTYNLVSIYEGDKNDDDETYQSDNYDTIDVSLFAASEVKDRGIHTILRYIKQSSIDCYINRTRNIRPGTDQDGSEICDYTTCDYPCAGIPDNFTQYLEAGNIDRTTKLLYYSEDEIEEATQEVTKLFARYHSLKNDQIYTFLPQISSIYIDLALEKMIRENVRVVDRLGFFGYIRESENGVIYVERDQFDIVPRPENTVYNSVLIGTQDPRNNIFQDYVTYLNLTEDTEKIKTLIDTDPSDDKFALLLDNLSLISKVTLLEYAIFTREETRRTNLFIDAILTKFFSSTYKIIEPVAKLQQVAMSFANRGKSRGRKPNPTSKVRIRKLSAADIQSSSQVPSFDIYQPPKKVFLHTLLNLGSHERTSYSQTSKYFKAEGQIRILKLGENIGWRDVNEYEYVVYNSAIQIEINRSRVYFEQFPIYGIIIPSSNILRIRDKEWETPDVEADKRDINDGKNCNNWDKVELVDVMYRLGMQPINEVPANITREKMLTEMLEKSFTKLDPPSKYTNEKLRYFYSWIHSQTSRNTMCVLIKEHFQRTGKLYTGRVPFPADKQQVGSIHTGPSPVVYEPEEGKISPPNIENIWNPIPLLQSSELGGLTLTPGATLPPIATNLPPIATNLPPIATNLPPIATNLPPIATGPISLPTLSEAL